MSLTRSSVALSILAAALPAALPAGTARAQDDDSSAAAVRVTRLRDAPITADAVADLRDGTLVLRSGDSTREVSVEDVVAIAFSTRPDPEEVPDADVVALDLWSGEEVRGRIAGGDERKLEIRTALLGTLEIELDALAGLRCLARLAAVEDPPSLSAPEEADAIHLVGGDRVDCTVMSIAADTVVCATDAADEVRLPMERVTALRLVQYEEPTPPERRFAVVLRDGTRLLGTDPAVRGGRLRLSSVSGFVAEPELTDVLAIHAMTSAFDYLSDLEPASVAVEPFWEPVAGDPAVLYAPRSDRAFSGGPLTVGERTWIKGLGVYAGTSLTWRIDGRYTEFRSDVGIDDAAGRLGAAVFEVLVDGERRWRSGLVRANSAVAGARGKPGPVSTGAIDVSDAETITLRVLPGDHDSPYPIQDEADWLGPMLVK